MISIAVANAQRHLKAEPARYRRAIRSVLREAGWRNAVISLALVDDERIHRLNKQFLGHDEPTDVLSFVLSDRPDCLEAEIVVSAQTARRVAARHGWKPEDELLLYIIHGTLHLVGYDDRSTADARAMRRRERYWLDKLELAARKPACRSRRGGPQAAIGPGAKRGAGA